VRLSICVATYNRADVIGETLASIIGQLTDGVELLVVDGASSDATGTVVQALLAGRGDCRYVRLPKRGGLDRDYATAVELARGEYCWLMTDDDVLKPRAVERVIEGLQGDPDLLVANAEVAGPDLRTTLLERKLDIAADRLFSPDRNSDLLRFAGDLLTFIGAVVIQRNLWIAREPSRYFGTEFVHVGVIFQAPLSRALVVADPLVRIRYGRAGWTTRAFEVWMVKWPQLVWSLPGIDDAAKEAVTPREPWRNTRPIVNMKAQGCYGLEEYRRWLRSLDMGALTRLRLVALAACPDALFAAGFSLLLPRLERRDRTMMRFELRQGRLNRRRS
jgi:abequosyltransferase